MPVINIRLYFQYIIIVVIAFFVVTNLLLGCWRKKSNKAPTISLFQNSTLQTNINKSIGAENIGFKSIAPGVIMTTGGGLGNQMFRYACSYALSKRLNLTLYIPLSRQQRTLNSDLKDVTQRKFVLHQNFPIIYKPLYSDQVKLNGLNLKYITELELLIDTDVIKSKGKFIQSESYCQSLEFFRGYETHFGKLFKQQISKEDRNNSLFRNWLNKITTSNGSVAIHIRRGDYAKEPLRIVPISFYIKAMKMMQQLSPKNISSFYVFSDSISLIKREITKANIPLTNLQFVSDPKELTVIQEFYLMRSCSHNIISDSSFSWWAAYLNQNPEKIVIAPEYPRDAVKSFGGDERVIRMNLLIYSVIYYPRDWIVLKYSK